MKRLITALILAVALISPVLSRAQTKLSSQQIALAEAWGRTTDHSLKFATLVGVTDNDFEIFTMSPVQRIAYITSEEASTHHGDILKSEMNLNRIRFSVTSLKTHQPSRVTLLSEDSKRALQPAHIVFEMNDRLADAEFEYLDVKRLASPSGTILIQITDEKGVQHRVIPFALKKLMKQDQPKGLR